jgi:hypothetical protein
LEVKKMKIAIVYESMFGNTHEVAEAIGDGVRKAQPDADVACVSVAEAAPALIKSTDLLVVGGPTHIRGMTTGFSRKMGVSGEEKLEAKASRLMRWKRMPKGRGSGSGSTVCQRSEVEATRQPSTLAFRRTWRAARPAGLPVGCVSTATTW